MKYLRELSIIILGLLMQSCNNDLVIPAATPRPTPSSGFDWTFQQSGYILDYHDVFFLNSQQGWVVGDNLAIFSTSTGGQSWPLVPDATIVGDLRSVFFVNDQMGWFGGGSFEDQTDGYLYESSMGGAYPTARIALDNNPINAIFFTNAAHGYCVGANGAFLLTTNGGQTWGAGPSVTTRNINDIHFSTDGQGWMVTDLGGIFHTANGTTWNEESSNSLSTIWHVFPITANNVWACGDSNSLFHRQLNASEEPEWVTSTIDLEAPGIDWKDIFFIDESTGWVVGELGLIYKTTDGGQTWKAETTGTTSTLNAIHMVSATKGWVVGDDGVILTYTPL